MAGLFIAFEGGEGAGKSTQAGILHDTLRQKGYRAELLHEPGSTPLGDYLRDYLIDDRPISPLAELLLFEASRAQLMAEQVRPLLADEGVVIVDRFAGSTIAYQGYGRGIKLDRITWLNDYTTGERYPDLTILLDIDPTEGLKRARSRRQVPQVPRQQLLLQLVDSTDRFEEEATDFHYQVSRGFLQQAAENSESWVLIDGRLPIESVAASVWEAVGPLLNAQITAEATDG